SPLLYLVMQYSHMWVQGGRKVVTLEQALSAARTEVGDLEEEVRDLKLSLPDRPFKRRPQRQSRLNKLSSFKH
ncbi:hypothetical protein KIPB_016885, partial [Kipferlia bialata]